MAPALLSRCGGLFTLWMKSVATDVSQPMAEGVQRREGQRQREKGQRERGGREGEAQW